MVEKGQLLYKNKLQPDLRFKHILYAVLHAGLYSLCEMKESYFPRFPIVAIAAT